MNPRTRWYWMGALYHIQFNNKKGQPILIHLILRSKSLSSSSGVRRGLGLFCFPSPPLAVQPQPSAESVVGALSAFNITLLDVLWFFQKILAWESLSACSLAAAQCKYRECRCVFIGTLWRLSCDLWDGEMVVPLLLFWFLMLFWNEECTIKTSWSRALARNECHGN